MTVYFLLESKSLRVNGTCLIPVHSSDTVRENRNRTIMEKSEVNNTLERFKDEVKFDEERYVVKLPWKTPEVRIPNNYEQAEQRLQQLEKRLNYNNERAKEYKEK
ncbi:hypothetical protein T05_2991 [Trichinella murrelli]|uniref:Uncharacterized protein n=1 Tax=Trichinella murrelli TaxID=144512 RepID=A0A0V0U5K3_9BILA|nr:hypothetical protein T05_2991 [Trichinella murrelli]